MPKTSKPEAAYLGKLSEVEAAYVSELRRWYEDGMPDASMEELDRLWAAVTDKATKPDRLKEGSTNRNKIGLSTLGHDAINRCILVKARAERMGINPVFCAECSGRGAFDTEPPAWS